MKIPAAKAAVDKEWENWRKFRRGTWLKSHSKKEVIDEARTKGAKVHFVSLMDICHLKNAELEAKHQKYKGWVVLRGDILKDDSGSYAVFTEQGSSASQMTAAKVMYIISRLPGSAGQAADAVSAKTQVKMEDAPKLLNIPKSECPDIWIRLPKHDMAKIMVQYGRSSRSSWAKSVRSSFSRTVIGKAIWENPIEAWLGENSKLGMSLCTSSKRVVLICVCGWHKIGWKETKHWSGVETTQQRSWFGRTNIFPWSCTRGLHSNTMWNKQRYCGQFQNHVLNPEFPQEQLKNFHTLRIFVFLHGLMIWRVMRRNVWSDIVSWQTRRLTTLQSIYSMHRWPPFLKRKKWNMLENCHKYALKLFWNALYLARIGRPDILWSVNKFGTIDYEMDQSLWQTPESIDFIYSSIRVNTNSIVMWVTLRNNAD